jgi:hypothetical protein
MLLWTAIGKCHTNTRWTTQDSTFEPADSVQLRSATVARMTSPESLSETWIVM